MVEGAEPDAAGPAGDFGHPLLQFIAVRLMLHEDPEDRHLDHEDKSIGSIYPAATIGSRQVDVRTDVRDNINHFVGVRRKGRLAQPDTADPTPIWSVPRASAPEPAHGRWLTSKAQLRTIAKRSGDYAAQVFETVARSAGGTTSPAP